MKLKTCEFELGGFFYRFRPATQADGVTVQYKYLAVAGRRYHYFVGTDGRPAIFPTLQSALETVYRVKAEMEGREDA